VTFLAAAAVTVRDNCICCNGAWPTNAGGQIVLVSICGNWCWDRCWEVLMSLVLQFFLAFVPASQVLEQEIARELDILQT